MLFARFHRFHSQLDVCIASSGDNQKHSILNDHAKSQFQFRGNRDFPFSTNHNKSSSSYLRNENQKYSDNNNTANGNNNNNNKNNSLVTNHNYATKNSDLIKFHDIEPEVKLREIERPNSYEVSKILKNAQIQIC